MGDPIEYNIRLTPDQFDTLVGLVNLGLNTLEEDDFLLEEDEEKGLSPITRIDELAKAAGMVKFFGRFKEHGPGDPDRDIADQLARTQME